MSDVGVVVTAYGRNPYLPLTLQSCVRYLPEGIPVTVIDDGSPDTFVRDVAMSRRDRVEYRRNVTRRGVGGSFNEAVAHSDTEYTLILGHDDVILPGFAHAFQHAVDRRTSTAAIHLGVEVIGPDGARARSAADFVKRAIAPKSERLLGGQALATSLMIGNWMYHPAIAWRTSVVREFRFDEAMVLCMDLDLCVRLALDGHQILVGEEKAVGYRRHGGSVSSRATALERLEEELAVQEQAALAFKAAGWDRAALMARLAPTVRAHAAMRSRHLAGDERREIWQRLLRRRSASTT